jgi:hypothetical protein
MARRDSNRISCFWVPCFHVFFFVFLRGFGLAGSGDVCGAMLGTKKKWAWAFFFVVCFWQGFVGDMCATLFVGWKRESWVCVV